MVISLEITGGQATNQINYELEGSNSGHYFLPLYTTSGDKYWRLYQQKNYNNYALSPSTDNFVQNVGTSGYKVGKNGDKNFKSTTLTTGVIAVHINQSTGGDESPYVWLERPTIYIWHNWNNNTSNWGNNGSSGQKSMTDNNDGTYQYDGLYSGGSTGTNVGIEGSAAIKKYFANNAATIVGSPVAGNKCRFVWNSSGYKGYDSETSNRGSLTITKLCTITYNANGDGAGNATGTTGSVPASQTDILYNTSTTVRGNTGSLAKKGYYLAGWNTQADGQGTTYALGSGSIKPTAATTTLYALWLPTWSVKGTFPGETDFDEDHLIANIGTNASSKDTGYVALTLPANTTIEFKLYARDYETWWSCSTHETSTVITYADNKVASGTCYADNSNKNMKVTTAGAGTYKFAWNITDKKVTIHYPTSYTVTFGYGTGGSAVTATVEDDASALVASGKYAAAGKDVTFTQTPATGYTFKGWYTTSDGNTTVSGMSTSDNVLDDIAANASVYAQYTPNVYSISYKEADGTTTITDLVPTSYTYGVGVDPLPTPTKSGYTFDGWFLDYCVVNSGGGELTEGCKVTKILTTDTGNAKYRAKWTQTVTLNTGSQGSGSNLTPTITYLGTSLSGFSSGHSAFGYSLLGYYSASSEGVKVLNADGTFANDDVEDYITDGKWTKTGATTLYAQWEDLAVDLPTTLNKGNVVAYSGDMTWHNTDYFDFGSIDAANTGRWAKWKVNVHPCQYTVSVVVDYPESPNGYQWGLILMSEDSEDTLAIYNSEQEWGYKSKTYTAKWDLRKDLEGNDLDGTYVLEVKNIYGYAQPKLQSLTLTAAPDAPTGFSAGSITDDDVTFSITDASNAASYDIYYSTSSTAPEAGTAATTTSTSKSKTVSGLTAGATYYAWVRSVCSGGTHKSAWVALNPGGDSHTFQTDYSITIGTITLRRGESEASPGGSISSDTTRARVDDEITLTATPESKYVFVAWQILDDESVDKTDDVLGADSTLTNPTFEMPDYNITVNATFVRQHTITYKESDRSTVIGGLAPTSYLYGEGVPSLPTPTKTGYTFAGWYSEYCVFEDEEAEGDPGYGWNEEECGRTSIETDDYGSVTLLATWTANTYTISLNNQSATSAGSTSISVTYDDDENLSDEPAITVPTKTCYTFGGYYTAVDGGGTQIIDADGNVNASVSGYTDASKNWKYANDLTLYAKWTQTNLALNKTPVAGYEPGNNDEKSTKITDGNTSTGWTTYSDQDPSVEWFYVDLGAYYRLSSVEVDWGAAGVSASAYSTDYIIQARQSAPETADRADDTKWFTIAHVTTVESIGLEATTVNAPARYVRLHSLSKAANHIRINEFRVFGTGAASADANAPVITTATDSYNNDGKAYLTLTATDTEDGTTNWFRIYNPKTETYSLQQTNESNQIIITGLNACTDYTFEVQAMDSSAQLSAVSEIIVNVPVMTGTNLALGKTATAGIKQGGFIASNAVDGNTGTMWSGNAISTDDPPGRIDGTNQWLNVNLGKNYDIDSIKIMWGSNGGTWPQDYEIQVSYNNADYTTIVHRTSKDNAQTQKYLNLDAKGHYVRVWATTAGTDYGMEIIELEVYGKCYTEDDIYDFTGQNASNTAWNTAANWTKGVVPGEGDTVRIFAPVVVPTGSTIQVDEVIIATDGATASGTMTATGKLTIAAGGAIIVEGTIKRCADASDLSTLVATTPDDILLESDASHGTGALISATASTNTAATVQLYTKARRDGGYVNQYIGIPFETMKSYNGFYGTYIYAFDVDLDKWSPTGSANFTMEGFAAYNLMRPEASATTLSMGDTLILPGITSGKNKVLTLTRRGSDVSLSVGTENLFANSWTAPIDITAMQTSDFVGAEATIYIFNAGTSKEQGSIGSATGTASAAGQWISLPISSVKEDPTAFGLTTIPAQQAFLVHASGAVGDTHTLTLDYKKHVYDPAVASGATIAPLRAPKAIDDKPMEIQLHVEGESGYADNVLLFVREDFTDGFDNGWDGRKIEGLVLSKQVPLQLYAVTPDGNMFISAQPDVEGTLIGFKAGDMDTLYTITFSYDGEDELFLIDTQAHKCVRVENGATYDFKTHKDDTDYHTRFALTRHNSPQITTGIGNGENGGNDGMKKAVKFINNDQLFILLNGVLYDATGRRIE